MNPSGLAVAVAMVFATACEPDIAPHGHLSLISGAVVPLYSMQVVNTKRGGDGAALEVRYETQLPTELGEKLASEALGQVFPVVAPRATRAGVSKVVVYAVHPDAPRARRVLGLPIPFYVWRLQTAWYTMVRKDNRDWLVLSSGEMLSVSDTAKAVAVALDSVEALRSVPQRVAQIRTNGSEIVVTVRPQLSDSPGDAATEVWVTGGQIRQVERLDY